MPSIDDLVPGESATFEDPAGHGQWMRERLDDDLLIDSPPLPLAATERLTVLLGALSAPTVGADRKLTSSLS